jgi:hypothetical protein
MRSIRKSGITALTAAIALSIGVIPVALTVPSIMASGDEAIILTPGATPAGQVHLATTSAKGTITYNGAVQEFTGGQQCEVTPIAGGAKLLKISGSVGDTQSGVAVAGFKDGDIGVFETTTSSPDNASQCFRVDAGSTTTVETLTIELDPEGPYSDAPFSERLLAGSATVDARVGNSRSGTIQISLQGVDGKWVAQAPATWSNLKAGSKISIPQLVGSFKAIRLMATSGSFSVRGADLNLVSQADKQLCPTNSYTDPNRSTTSVTYVGSSTGSCFGVTLTSGPTSLRFLKPSTVSPDAQFVFNTDWTLDNPGGAPGVTIPNTSIDFELGSLNVNQLPFCSNFTAFVDGAGNPILTRDSGSGNLKISNYAAFSDPTNAFEDLEDASAEKEWGCVDRRSSDVTADEIIVHDEIFVIGDVRMFT